MDNCGMDNFPLTLTLSLKGRGNFIVLLVVGCCVLLDAASVALAETVGGKGDRGGPGEGVGTTGGFRDVPLIFRGAQRGGGRGGPNPLEPRQFTVTYTGMIPPRLFPIQGEAKVDYVKWTK